MQKNNKKIFLGLFTGAIILLLLFFFLHFRDRSENADGTMGPNDPAKDPFIDFSEGTPSGEPSTAELQPRHPIPPLAVDQVEALSETEKKKWTILQEVLESRNDNDPRMDELKNLSPAFHNALANAYSELPMNRRNERGTIAFLMGRDMQSVQDIEFLQSVVSEPPCYSFENCDTPAATDPHLADVNEVSLNYPQLAALYQVEANLDANPEILQDPARRDAIRSLLREALQFPIPAVKNKAGSIMEKFGL
ncbi:MAG: hypothetical protein V4736_03975 [Bdellovibrionota bacterium]